MTMLRLLLLRAVWTSTETPRFPGVSLSEHRREQSPIHAVMWKVKDQDAPELSVQAKDEFTIIATARRGELKSTGPNAHGPMH